MELILTTLTPEPHTVTPEELERYLDWRISYNDHNPQPITEEEFCAIPQNGLAKPDGFYSFTFSGGCIYVEIEDSYAIQLAGFKDEEFALFKALTEEHGEEIQRKIDLKGTVFE
jgi:hypothetical protein